VTLRKTRPTLELVVIHDGGNNYFDSGDRGDGSGSQPIPANDKNPDPP